MHLTIHRSARIFTLTCSAVLANATKCVFFLRRCFASFLCTPYSFALPFIWSEKTAYSKMNAHSRTQTRRLRTRPHERTRRDNFRVFFSYFSVIGSEQSANVCVVCAVLVCMLAVDQCIVWFWFQVSDFGLFKNIIMNVYGGRAGWVVCCVVLGCSHWVICQLQYHALWLEQHQRPIRHRV